MKDTYICARASGDQAYLQWLHDRLIYKYGESTNVDFVQTLPSFVAYFQRRQAVPTWLDWLLRKYEL